MERNSSQLLPGRLPHLNPSVDVWECCRLRAQWSQPPILERVRCRHTTGCCLQRRQAGLPAPGAGAMVLINSTQVQGKKNPHLPQGHVLAKEMASDSPGGRTGTELRRQNKVSRNCCLLTRGQDRATWLVGAVHVAHFGPRGHFPTRRRCEVLETIQSRPSQNRPTVSPTDLVRP